MHDNAPHMADPRNVADRTWLLGAWLPVPGLGVLPVNAYVIQSIEPVLVDTGIAVLQQEFLHTLERVIDPDRLAWIWITHMDPDHVGNLSAVLEVAPRARVVTTWLGMGKMGLLGLPQERAWLLNPGQALDLGDRKLRAVVPPCFDAPETTSIFDECTRAWFSADALGAVQPGCSEDARQVDPGVLWAGVRLWTSVDVPWLQWADPVLLESALDRVRHLRPEVILGSHLQPARGMTDRLLKCLLDAARAPAFQGADQLMLATMMAKLQADPG